MPTINRKAKRRHIVKPTKTKQIEKLYNSSTWRLLRQGYLMAHPLCELCEDFGRTSVAEEVHHIYPISEAKDELEMRYRAYNPNNLMSLCKDCHHKVHNERRRQKNL